MRIELYLYGFTFLLLLFALETTYQTKIKEIDSSLCQYLSIGRKSNYFFFPLSNFSSIMCSCSSIMTCLILCSSWKNSYFQLILHIVYFLHNSQVNVDSMFFILQVDFQNLVHCAGWVCFCYTH